MLKNILVVVSLLVLGGLIGGFWGSWKYAARLTRSTYQLESDKPVLPLDLTNSPYSINSAVKGTLTDITLFSFSLKDTQNNIRSLALTNENAVFYELPCGGQESCDLANAKQVSSSSAQINQNVIVFSRTDISTDEQTSLYEIYLLKK